CFYVLASLRESPAHSASMPCGHNGNGEPPDDFNRAAVHRWPTSFARRQAPAGFQRGLPFGTSILQNASGIL
ncbi:hypothetical protein, partial [Salmonella enterica]|uniref:hypothetical protein n=1 Tax=Salmonella enterica TaxID=28901 RepID=UPI001C62E367